MHKNLCTGFVWKKINRNFVRRLIFIGSSARSAKSLLNAASAITVNLGDYQYGDWQKCVFSMNMRSYQEDMHNSGISKSLTADSRYTNQYIIKRTLETVSKT